MDELNRIDEAGADQSDPAPDPGTPEQDTSVAEPAAEAPVGEPEGAQSLAPETVSEAEPIVPESAGSTEPVTPAADAGETPDGADVPAEAEGEPNAFDPTDIVESDEVGVDDLVSEIQAIADQEDTLLRALVEAIIYITEEPVTPQQIAAALQRPLDKVRQALEAVAEEFDKPEHGMTVREIAGGYKMATKAEHHEVVRAFVKSLKPPLKLSLAALETLAVIAYKQPITAPEIMEIRGVQGAGVLKTLLDRKLIVAAGRKQVIGKPVLYKSTKEFLVQFGLKDLSELPTLKEFEEIRRMSLPDSEQALPVEKTAEVEALATPGPDTPPPSDVSEESTLAAEAVPVPVGQDAAVSTAIEGTSEDAATTPEQAEPVQEQPGEPAGESPEPESTEPQRDGDTEAEEAPADPDTAREPTVEAETEPMKQDESLAEPLQESEAEAVSEKDAENVASQEK